MPNNQIPLEEEPNPFADMPIDAAFIHKHCGEEGLRQLFEREDKLEGFSKEDLEEIAAALEQRALTAPATIIRNLAREALSRYDESRCPYPEPGHNRDYWLHSNRVRRLKETGELSKMLRRQAGKKNH
jgi:hypothetical protein